MLWIDSASVCVCDVCVCVRDMNSKRQQWRVQKANQNEHNFMHMRYRYTRCNRLSSLICIKIHVCNDCDLIFGFRPLRLIPSFVSPRSPIPFSHRGDRILREICTSGSDARFSRAALAHPYTYRLQNALHPLPQSTPVQRSTLGLKTNGFSFVSALHIRVCDTINILCHFWEHVDVQDARERLCVCVRVFARRLACFVDALNLLLVVLSLSFCFYTAAVVAPFFLVAENANTFCIIIIRQHRTEHIIKMCRCVSAVWIANAVSSSMALSCTSYIVHIHTTFNSFMIGS